MYKGRATIQNSTGLHARPASEFVACAGQFQSKIEIHRVGDQNLVDAKSIIMLLTQALEQGAEIELIADGTDEVEAVTALIELINIKFGEE